VRARPGWWCHEPAPDEIIEWVEGSDGRQPRDRLASARHYHLGATLNVLQMLAETIVKLTHSNLIFFLSL
jgi:hypothetical protein